VVEGRCPPMLKKNWRYEYIKTKAKVILWVKQMHCVVKEVPIGESPAPDQDPVMAVEMDVEQHSGKDWFQKKRQWFGMSFFGIAPNTTWSEVIGHIGCKSVFIHWFLLG
jgi:uncharacterized protein YifN (PemK superfamily)